MAQPKIWKSRFERHDRDSEIRAIAKALRLSPLTASLLYHRGYTTPEQARCFIQVEQERLHDPFLMTDMAIAASRVARAVREGEKIVVYGDYDADGVTATALLTDYLRRVGACVDYFIPDRFRDGYGMHERTVRELSEGGCALIVTVDNGISAVEPIALAGELGMDVVVTDHHEPHGTLPAALAVVDPHREGDRYPFPDLAGVGVAFKLACAVDALLDPDRDRWRELCLRYLDLVAFGTIADVMTLTGENRLIVAMGLPLIERGERIGLRALMEQAGVARHLSASAVSFTLAPRINAAGRLGSALRAVELLLEESPVIADDIAVELCRRNKERQAEEAGIAQSAAERIRLLGLEEDPFFVLDHDDWHPGITGIAASRLTERTSRPSLLITYDGEVGKGSARSVEGVNLMALLAECDDLLIQYGGHEMAAGLTVEREKVPALRARLCALMREQYPCGLPEPVCLADCEITLSEVSVEQIGQLRALEPCGAGNPQPLFLLRSLHIADMTAVGGGKHTRLQLRQGRDSITAMYFGVCPEQMDYLVGDEVDLLAQMELNEWNGRVSAQLLIRDMDHAADYAAEQLHRRRLIEDYLSGSDTALSSPFLPARADFAHLYRYLRRACAGGDLEMGLRALCLAGLEGENRTYKGPLILRIFTETGLLRTEQIECPVADSGSCRACRVRIAVPDQAGSVDLMQNPLYRRLVSEV